MSNSLIKNWIEETRPKTLAASLSPVIIACAIALSEGVFITNAALLCIGVAVLSQIASNFANDYFDFKHGIDSEERLGPERAVLKGRISLKAMLIGSLVTIGLACACGLGLLMYADWKIILVGALIAISVFAYSAGPWPLSQHALGDVAVLLFYGVIPVTMTYYVMAGHFSLKSLLFSIGVGLLSVNILMVNNYRDIEQDRAVNKITTAVLFGRKPIYAAYLINVLISSAFIIIFSQTIVAVIVTLTTLLLGIVTWIEMGKKDGQELNIPFEHTARNVLIYSILCSISITEGLLQTLLYMVFN